MRAIRRHRLESAGSLRLLRWGSLVVPLALAALYAVASWSDAVAEARDRAQANARLTAEFAHRLLLIQETLIAAGEEFVLRFHPDRAPDASAHRFLRDIQGRAGAGLGVGLISPEGDFIVSSAAYPAVGNVGERDYLALARDPAATGLFVDRIRIQPGGVDALVVARRHPGPPPGVWASALDIGTIRDFLRQVAPSEDEAASILRPDGRLLARSLEIDGPITLSPAAPGVEVARSADRGAFETTAESDGVRRIYAVERAGDLELFAAYGVAVPAIREAWARRLAIVGGLLGAVGLAGYLAARYAARSVEAEAGRAALEFDRALLAEAEKTAQTRQMMLQELNHRVKNSLQMIDSLIRLQKARPEGPDLDAVASRVMAIAQIHDLLHRSADALNVDFAALLGAICRSQAIVPPERGVELVCDSDALSVRAALATPLALVAVELVTNAVKHAFGPSGGRIALTLRASGREATLTVEDDGRGLPAAPRRSSGIRVVDALVTQLRGELAVDSGPRGTRYAIRFPLDPPDAGAQAA
jgi:two-component sensor histidine kinase